MPNETPLNSYFNYGNNFYQQSELEYGNTELDNVFTRFLYPELAEAKEFDRENYMMDKANAFNEYMFNKANEYNSPAAQMERAREAGINLNLATGGIMGGGNAVATPMQSTQGGSQMNTNAESPANFFGQLMNGITNGINGTKVLGELFGFGKKNKSEINQINQIANQAAEQANFTYWQKRQFRRTMQITSEQAYANYDVTIQQLNNLKKQYDILEQQKWNIAEDTNLKTAQTGQVKEETKNIWYKNQEEAFKKIFRDMYGVNLNESDISMLTQLMLSGKGDVVIDAISNTLRSIKDAMFNTEDNNWWQNNMEMGDKVEKWLNKAGKNAHDKWIRHYCINVAKGEWERMPKREKNKWPSAQEFVIWKSNKLYNKKMSE